VHSPKNTGAATGEGGSAGYQSVVNGGGTHVTVRDGAIGYTDVSSTRAGSPTGFAGRIVGIAARPDGSGYWLMSETGQVYSYGSARYLGGSPAGYSGTLVKMVPTPSGNGYWLFTSAGQTYGYGDAHYLGNVPGPMDDMADISCAGYLVVDKSGYHCAFGSVLFSGNPTGFAGTF
jgi:hypothetical protein